MEPGPDEQRERPTPAPVARRRRRPVSYLRSGFYSKQAALVPPADSAVGQVLRERRGALIADLGGAENVTTAQLALVDPIVAAWATLSSVDAYLLTLPSLVDRRHRRVWQVVRDRATLASQLQSLLRDVGLNVAPGTCGRKSSPHSLKPRRGR